MGYGLHVFGAAGVIRGIDCILGKKVEQTVIMNNQVITPANLSAFEALDLSPVSTYNGPHFSEFITVNSTTLAKCPPF